MANDLWRTPPEVYSGLNREFNFAADIAASKENALHECFYTEEDDSLSIDWSREVFPFGKVTETKYLWCNPPYSNPMPWVKLAIDNQLKGVGTVMLLNNDMSVGWFAEALKGVSEIRCIVADPAPESKREYSSGRLAFLDESGTPVSGNNKPQFVLVFNPFKIGAQITSYVRKSELYGE
ncbi:hypothetical protein KKJFFJLC_00046 [Vibrio phage vB_VpaS_PGB]|nr:hypothetical protein HHKILHMN_00051 [Vibrio phage vB_VpaS_PGA]WVH05589.1 hypothetical protein KKJFFJLC_00046 [Vibrio phage vB_VpaS_PGB]